MGLGSTAARVFHAAMEQLAKVRGAYVAGALSERALVRAEAQALSLKKRPYETWTELPKRPAARASDTRQNERRDYIAHAFRHLTQQYPGESRADRRRWARSRGRRDWREACGLPEPGGVRA